LVYKNTVILFFEKSIIVKKLLQLNFLLLLFVAQGSFSQNVAKTPINSALPGSKPGAASPSVVVANLTDGGSCNEPEPDPCDGKTFTQGGWGAGNGNPASTYLNTYFSTYYPNGLTIGCGSRKLKLTNAAAVFAFLPSGSTPAILPTGTLTNPGGAYSNVLAGQLVALTLNMGFDANNAGFSPSAHSLGNYTITSGIFSGMSVNAFLNLANSIIGGCSSQYSYSQLNTAATAINENYDNGSSNGYLICPPVCNITVTAISGSISCFSGLTNVTITATGGTAPYTGTGVFSRPAGVHSFTVTDSYGCQAVKSKTLTQPSQLIASASNGSISCNGGTATISVNASGGTAPYSGTGTFTRTAGVHSFTVTDSKGCTAVISKVLTQPTQLSLTATNGTINCFGGTATLCVTASGGSAPYSGTGTFTRPAGVHSFTVTDSKGCSAVITKTLTQPSQLFATATNGSISCFGGTATVSVNASGGNAPYSGTGTFTRTAGVHSFTVTDSKGCFAVITKTLTQPLQLLVTATNGSINCYGGTATVSVNASGGSVPYTGTGTFTRTAGVHSFTVTDIKGCSAAVTKTITQPFALSLSHSSTNGSCNTNNLGSATVTASGGTAPYSYLWSNNATTSVVSGLTAGTYSALVTDANACSASSSISITSVACCNVTAPGSISGSAAGCGPVCNVSLGSISPASGGIGSVQYIWIRNSQPNYPNTGNNGWVAIPNSNSPTLAVGCVTATTYYIRCARNSGCSQFVGESNMLSVIINPGPNAYINTSPILCYGGTATTTLSANGGTAPYSGTGIFTVNAGPYSYTVTDANGCSSAVSGTITQPTQLAAVSSCGTVSCNGGSTSINVGASGGTPPYSGTGPFSVGAGVHTYTVTDANGCTAITTQTVSQPNSISLSANIGSISCYGGTTTVNISATGGSAPYAGTGLFTRSAGSHTFWVTDALGCSQSITVTLTQPSALTVSAINGTINCNGETTTMNVSANGGTAPYTGTGIFTVNAGPYSYTVTDANGCSSSINGAISQPNVLSASAINGTIGCNGGTTTVSLSANGGTTPYAGVGIFTVNAGPYSYTLTDANGCSASVNGNITQPSALTALAINGTINCYGGTTTVNISANGGTLPYTGTETYSVNAGPYSYTVTDANGCSTNLNGNITQPSLLTASAVSGTIICGGTTTVSISANGGTAPYAGVGIYTVNAGPYSFTVTDNNGCTAFVNGNISQPSALTASAVNGTINCNGGTTTVNISASGGTAPYFGTGTFTVNAGPYTYTVSDANGCSTLLNGLISQPAVLITAVSSGTIGCNGGTTTLNISAIGGTAPYTGTGIFTVSSGPYSYTVTDTKGCSTSVNGSITEPSILTASVINGTIKCNGGTATISINANGGTAPYSGTGIFTVSAGPYTMTVTDANGCLVNANGNIAQPSVLTASAVNGTIACGGTTTVNIDASGGVSPYTGVGIYSVIAGPYTFTVTDTNGCTALVSGTITQPSALTASAINGSISCNGGTTTLTISASGGTAPYIGTGTFAVNAGPYSYTVTDANGCSTNINGNIGQPNALTASALTGSINCYGGSTTATVFALGGTAPYSGIGIFTVYAGPYSYTVTDANGCSTSVSGSITQPNALTASALNGSINCNGGTTTVNVSALGGTAPYSGIGSFTASAGAYTYTVSDANGCSANVSGNISQPSAITATALFGTINCYGGSTTLSISASGGTAPYTGVGTFSVNAGAYSYTVTDVHGCSTSVNGNISQPGALTTIATTGSILCNGGSTTVNISANGGTAPYSGIGTFTVYAGPYSFTVTDANGCTEGVSGNISQPSGLIGNATYGTINCNGGATTINISANGGTAPYSGIGIFTVNAGPFSYTLTDANGCKTSVGGNISQPSALMASAVNGTITCNGGTTTVTVSAIGGTAPYTGTGTFTVNAGPYSFTVTDANACTASISGTITQPNTLTASVIAGTINCNGGTTTINVSALGGTSPYSGTGTFTVSAGLYSYTVTDASGCSASVSGNITQPSAITASVTHGAITCNGGTTTLTLSALGGTAPYTNTGTFTLSAGPFTYTVTDTNGCYATVSGTITQPNLLTASSENGTINCNGGITTVSVSASGGTAPYSGTGIFTVYAGPYTYTITDANGCIATVSGTISQPSVLIASAVNGSIACGGTTTVNIGASGGTAPYSGTGIYTVVAGPYSFSVTDANACLAIVSGTISQPAALTASAINGSINCYGGTTSVNISANGGTAPYSGTGTFTVMAGPYTFTVTDTNGCLTSVNGNISQPSALVASAANGTINCNGGTSTVNISASGGTAPYFGTGTFSVNAGPFTLTVTDANGCTTNASGNMAEPPTLSISSAHGSVFCYGETTTLNISASGGTAPYAGIGTYSVSAGTQTFTVLDALGCMATTVVTVTQPNALVLNFSAGTILCNGGTTASTITASGGTAPYGGTGVFTVSAGVQTLTIVDAQGCTASSVVTLTEPSPLVLNFAAANILCNGGTTSATITASGGTAPYFGTGVFVISAGSQTLTIIDAQGCTATSVVNITEPSPLSVTVSSGNILCNGGNTSATVSASGGTAPYGGTGTFVIGAGVQTITVVDAQGCSASTVISVTEPNILTLSFVHDSITCNGGSASSTISASGGTSPYGGTGVFMVGAGAQTLTVIDAQGCTASTVVNISEPLPLNINFVTDSILCSGGSASATISATGGTAPYGGTGTFTLSAGIQTLVVIDAHGCITSSAISLTEPSPVVISILADSVLCNGGSAYVTVSATGGIAPYNGTGLFLVSAGVQTYTVSDANGCYSSGIINLTEPSPLLATFVADSILCNGGTASATISASGGTAPYTGTGIYFLTPGFYSYQVTDYNGCTENVSRYITEPSALVASFFEDSIRCYGGYATIVVGASGGTSPYTGVGTFTVFAGNHNYTVSDTNGCTTSTILTITQPPQLVANSIVNTNILCHGDSASVTVFATGGSGSYLNMVTDSMPCMNDSLRAMLAANGGTVPYWGPDTYMVPAGTYTYGVVDSRCCWDTAQITITEPLPLLAGSILGDIACNNNPTNFTITASGGTSPYSGTGIQSMPAGSYTFQVFDANNCQDTTVVTIDTTFCTGFEENVLAEHSVFVYPNPNNGSFRISGLFEGKGRILSQSGQLIRELEFKENEEILIENLAKGLYFLVTPQLKTKIVVLSD